MMKKILGVVIFLGLLSSCIPTNRITYLQNSNDVKNDSLLTIRKVHPPYRFQIGDILQINIKAPFDPNLTDDYKLSSGGGQGGNAQQIIQGGLYFTGYTINQQGYIRVPDLGLIKALGKTNDELRVDIEKVLLEKNFKDTSQLFVDVKLEGLRYVMVGEVNTPGQTTILRDQVSIIEAVAQGGGVPITGDLTAVKLIRQYDGGIRTHELDLTSIDVINSPYYYLRPNDMLVFQPLPQKALGVGTTGLSTFTTVISVFTTVVTTYLLIDNLTNR